MTTSAVARELDALFHAAGCRGALQVEALDGSGSISLDADAPMVTASTFKVFVALELFEQSAEGRLDLHARVTIDPTARTYGPTGLSCFSDAADLSLGDLAYMMLAVSDNAATDALVDRVGLDAINARLAALGLHDTAVPYDLAGVLQEIAEHVGFTSYDELARAKRETSAAKRSREPWMLR